ncbi:Cyanophycinase [metagenome]|uniref:Cyanophycinase n=1 Tax=metagenome TaxID=256318 RepID=A0A2P2C6S6_9ZZZZ
MPTPTSEGEPVISSTPRLTVPGPGRGPLMVIGGAEDKLRRRNVLSEFVRAAGGPEARIAVIPTASSLGPEVVEVYDALFTRLGAASVVSARPETRDQAHDPAYVDVLDDVTGIFMTGGNQLKLSGVICGTPFGKAIRMANERGAVIGGTSAGASIQSSHMVAFGVGGTTPKQRMTQVAAGLGLLETTVIDQHFEQRNRYGRLLMIVAQSPQLLGMGVDEDTAAVVRFDGDQQTLEVVGRGAVTIFDPARVVTNAHEVPRSQPIMTSGVVLHVLTQGSRFDLVTRTLIPMPSAIDESEAADIAEAGRDLRRMARDIAAGDASPSVLRRRLARSRKQTPPRQNGADS